MEKRTRLFNWREVPQGGVIVDPGSSAEVETGSWRAIRPALDMDRCVHCMICWIFCPDSCFLIKEGRLASIDYEHCKGCGICARECPKECIEMVSEFSSPSAKNQMA